MTKILGTLSLIVAAMLAATPVIAEQFVVELDKPLDTPAPELMERYDIALDETLSAGADSYAVFSAANVEALQGFLAATSVHAEKISEVMFVNSPTVGGGESAGPEPRAGQHVYVIERPIPGVGFFGLEKWQKISRGSNAAVGKLAPVIEWDHSYLTSEGTYCIYRADSPDTIREHGALAGAPIGKITLVNQTAY